MGCARKKMRNERGKRTTDRQTSSRCMNRNKKWAINKIWILNEIRKFHIKNEKLFTYVHRRKENDNYKLKWEKIEKLGNEMDNMEGKKSCSESINEVVDFSSVLG